MQMFVRPGIVAAVSALLLAAPAQADAANSGRKPRPGLIESLFGGFGNQDAGGQPARRRSSGFGSFKDGLFSDGRKPRQGAPGRAAIADTDPQDGIPGLGMGNLTYVPPKLVPLSGLAPGGARPAAPDAAAIYDQLVSGNPAVRVLPAARDALAAQYAARSFRPIWLEGGRLSERGKDVLKLLARAGDEGLEPQSYLPTGLAGFDAPLPEADPAAMARLDIDLSAAALRYAHDASGGQFDPARLSRYNDLQPPWVAPDKAINVIANTPFPVQYLQSLHPTHPAYAAMKKALAEFRAGQAAPPQAKIADGAIVKKGEADERIPSVRARLSALGFTAEVPGGADPETLDAGTSAQLRLFQQQAGIKVTGALGPQTVAALNGSGGDGSIGKLLGNMERIRWLPRDLGRRYVFVNQAAFEATVMKDGQPEWQTRVIVGKPDTQTAVFNDEMEMVVFNPSWGVPPSIIAHEYLPKLRRDPAYLDKQGFKVVNQQGKVVPSRSVSWGSYGSKVPYGIQQPPGAKNALGEIKFLFPNSHDIYMHDTPSRDLFEKDVRAFSHGCVRVQNPREFAAVVLGWTPEEVAAKVERKASETVRLKQKLPVHIVYFTAWPDKQGNIVYFNDIYGRDNPLENARTARLLAQR
ncbi:MAG: L,D-transpeptidase family protein [Aestuariivirga sp.]|uniref:L,D-transpeptidase family protein n=1 Tax=Aestuariivirga sp. TaxID=2650926 RepID=UPI0025B92F80|nr:L,D-transpeptidase family protein [Aestuariivirga sp.]MCA3562036.1 L,D-transpeptidase family protein [Aestuariivirga sp.]